MTQIPSKTGSTTTIAFRVSPSIDEQIEEIAKTLGQSKSNWVRDQVMQSFHSSDPSNTPPVHTGSPAEEIPPIELAMIESRLEACEKLLHRLIDELTTTIVQLADSHHRDLCTLGILVLDAQEAIEQRTDDSCDELLDAIERLKQSQRSHKESLQRAITRPEDTTR
jgi:predicted DNA-binding protein